MLGMAGDDLAIFLFLAGLVAAFGVAGFTQTGFKKWLLYFLTVTSFAAAWFLPWGREHAPLVEAQIKEVAASPISWFMIVMFLVGTVLLSPSRASRDQADNRTATATSAVGAVSANTKADAIQLRLGRDDKFERVENQGSRGVLSRLIYVAICNTGDGFLSECKLLVKNVAPAALAGTIPAALAWDFTLIQGEVKYVPVVGFAERTGDWTHALSDNIIVSVPVPPGFFSSGWTTLGMPPKENPTIITLEASALQCSPCIRHYSVWVDAARRLRMEPA
jgi:hypothetical protein